MKRFGSLSLLLIVLALLAFVVPVNASPPQDELTIFYNSISAVESSGGKNIIGDDGASIGHYQIQRAYWYDATHNAKGKRIHDGKYEDVKNPAYARQVMLWYWQRYAATALAEGDWQTLARIHNGGPNGAKVKATQGYWRKVQAEMSRRGFI